jgi:hypothetical protein
MVAKREDADGTNIGGRSCRLRYTNDDLVSYALSIRGQTSGIMLNSVVRISGGVVSATLSTWHTCSQLHRYTTTSQHTSRTVHLNGVRFDYDVATLKKQQQVQVGI